MNDTNTPAVGPRAPASEALEPCFGQCGITELRSRLTAVEAERAELREYVTQRCSDHPADPLELVCVECFESEKTAAATERAVIAEAERATLRAEIAHLQQEQAK